MIKQIALLFCLCSSILSIAQTDKIINVDETNRILSFLASDAMKGRRTNTPEIDMAADFIAAEFKKS
jgi:hypothetical protein